MSCCRAGSSPMLTPSATAWAPTTCSCRSTGPGRQSTTTSGMGRCSMHRTAVAPSTTNPISWLAASRMRRQPERWRRAIWRAGWCTGRSTSPMTSPRAGERYRLLGKMDQDHLVDNIVSSLCHAEKPIQERMVSNLAKADPELRRHRQSFRIIIQISMILFI